MPFFRFLSLRFLIRLRYDILYDENKQAQNETFCVARPTVLYTFANRNLEKRWKMANRLGGSRVISVTLSLTVMNDGDVAH